MSGPPDAEVPSRATITTGPRVLLATRNAGKLAELRRMLAGDAVVLGLDDVVAFDDQPETGATFEENALAKARHAAAVTGEVVLADDSGLAVDALNGMPGVLSARWSGRHGDDRANTALLLGQLADVPDERPDRSLRLRGRDRRPRSGRSAAGGVGPLAGPRHP